jgi:hypothetical protein
MDLILPAGSVPRQRTPLYYFQPAVSYFAHPGRELVRRWRAEYLEATKANDKRAAYLADWLRRIT